MHFFCDCAYAASNELIAGSHLFRINIRILTGIPSFKLLCVCSRFSPRPSHEKWPAGVSPFDEVVDIRIFLRLWLPIYIPGLFVVVRRGVVSDNKQSLKIGMQGPRPAPLHTHSSSPSSLVVVSWDRPYRPTPDTKTWRVLHATLLEGKCHICRGEPGGPPHRCSSKLIWSQTISTFNSSI